MNQKQIPAMQQSTVSSFETLWCPGLISLLASLDSILSRLLSPSFCSSHDDHQCSLPCTPVWSVLHPSVVISQHLTPRTIPSFSCPWLLGCWILLVFVCLFVCFYCLLGSAFLGSLDGPWVFIPADVLIFDPYVMEFSRKGLAVRSLLTYVFLPSVSILPSCWWSRLFPQSWLIPRMPDLHMPPAAPPLECHTKVKSTGAKHNSGFSRLKPAYTLPAPGVISVRDNCLSSCSGQMPLSPRFLPLTPV